MMRNTLPPLLQQFVAPLFQLRGDGPDAGGLFDGCGFDAPGLMITRLRILKVHHGIGRSFIEPFAKLFQHLDGGVDLSSGWCLHDQT